MFLSYLLESYGTSYFIGFVLHWWDTDRWLTATIFKPPLQQVCLGSSGILKVQHILQWSTACGELMMPVYILCQPNQYILDVKLPVFEPCCQFVLRVRYLVLTVRGNFYLWGHQGHDLCVSFPNTKKKKPLRSCGEIMWQSRGMWKPAEWPRVMDARRVKWGFTVILRLRDRPADSTRRGDVAWRNLISCTATLSLAAWPMAAAACERPRPEVTGPVGRGWATEPGHIEQAITVVLFNNAVIK